MAIFYHHSHPLPPPLSLPSLSPSTSALTLTVTLSLTIPPSPQVNAVGSLASRIDARDSDFRYLLMGMLEIDPDKRITPREALRCPFLADR